MSNIYDSIIRTINSILFYNKTLNRKYDAIRKYYYIISILFLEFLY